MRLTVLESAMLRVSRRIDELPFRRKLRLASTVAAVALGTIVATNLLLGVVVERQQQSIYAGYYPGVRLIDHLETLLGGTQRALQDAVSAHDLERLSSVDSLHRAFSAAVDSARSNPVLRQSRLDSLEATYGGYNHLARATAAGMIAGDDVSAALQDLLRQHNAVREGLVADATAESAAIAGAFGRLRVLQRAGLTVTAVVTLLCIGALGWLSGVTTRSLTGSVDEAVRGAMRLAEGDVSVDVSAGSNDELGQLLRAMQQVVAYLREMAAVANAVARGEVDTPITPRSANDTFGNALLNMTTYLGEMAHVADTITAGQLDAHLTPRSAGDRFGHAFVAMSARLSELIADIHDSADAVSTAATQLTASAQTLAEGASEEASSVEQTTATLSALTESIGHNMQLVRRMESEAAIGAVDAAESGRAMSETVAAMKSISSKVTSINRIATQTDLLALNAAIEAARGDGQARGFTVVADEVRKLSDLTSRTADDITCLVSKSTSTAERSGELLEALVPRIRKTAEVVQAVSQASAEQVERLGLVDRAMEQVGDVTQRNAAAAEQLAAMSQELSAQSELLQQLIAYFRVDARAGATVSAVPLRAMTKTRRSLANGKTPLPGTVNVVARSSTRRPAKDRLTPAHAGASQHD